MPVRPPQPTRKKTDTLIGIDKSEPFADKMLRFVAELDELPAKGVRLDAAISKNLAGLGFASPSASKR